VSWYPSSRWPLLRVAVSEHSMVPALRHGDWLVALRTRRIRPGQIVLAAHPERPGFLLVKRAGKRARNGWWLVSDFPDAPGATDSRHFGPVAPEQVIGRVLARYWPRPKIFRTERIAPTASVPPRL
jgi:nickel-type superoxide dismutase maturation protease